MSNLSDKDLDKIFNEAYESYPLDTTANSWEDMHTILDKEMPEKRKNRKFFFFFLFLFLGLCIGGLLLNFNHESNKINTTYNTTKRVSRLPYEKNINKDSDKKNNNNTALNKYHKYESIIKNINNLKPVLIVENTISTEDYGKNARKKIFVKRKVKMRAFVKGLQLYSTNTDSSSKSKWVKGELTNAINKGMVEKNEKVVQEDENLGISNHMHLLYKKYIITPEKLLNREQQFLDTTRKITSLLDISTLMRPELDKTHTDTLKQQQYFEVGIVAGIAANAVKFSSNSKNGFNAGLYVGYVINKRWALNTGLIYSQKDYVAMPADYHSPKDHFLNNPGIILNQADGFCKILELPLNIRYNITTTKKSNLFLGTGLSSYFMKNEEYTFYGTDFGTPFIKGLEGDEVLKSAFWFPVLNLSAGFQKSINNTYSLQIEPYIKIPLKGVGFGEVLLSSYGANITVKRSFKFTKK
jgi:hypothetical protein